MTIQITYEIPTMNGNWNTHKIEVGSKQKAKATCKACERLGYKIIDVTRTK